MNRGRLWVILVLAVGLPLSAGAAEIRVKVSGEEFLERPIFGLYVDEREVGRAQLDSIPASGEFEEITLSVPDKELRNAPTISIRLLNDAYEGEDSDINLYIGGLAVGSNTFGPDGFSTLSGGEPSEPRMLNGALVLLADNEEATVSRPEGGWIDPLVCDASVTISGFERYEHTLSDAQKQQLTEALLGQALSGECAIDVKGYASQGGDPVANVELSERRAETVLVFLGHQGASFESVVVTAGGETNQFGEDRAPNRAVTAKLLLP